MSPIRRFRPEDIGVELFPALTRGLYRDPLDALREYIQNAIDAKADRVDITLTRDVVSVNDNGAGMTPEQAQAAIRLGISDKNPVDHVGFRGIGIYSSFDLCERLEIHTRPAKGHPSLIVVDFRTIRALLADEEQRRRRREPPQLHLELMLSQAVRVEEDQQSPVLDTGTLVLMREVRGGFYKKLNDIGQVRTYLQAVIPLPFDDDFRFAKPIGREFRKEDYRVVSVTLTAGGREVAIYRPYHNAMFAHGGQYEPRFYDVTSPETGERYGFAWVCINDARKVFDDRELRGLLIKKKGFSVADRGYLEPIFGRTVVSRRVTGEVIVEHSDLIPNASRSDFESNGARADFQVALLELTRKVSEWVDEVQQKLKAFEQLDEVSPRVFEIHSQIPSFRQDTQRLLDFNVELSQLKRPLDVHSKVLESERPRELKKALAVIAEAEAMLRDMLSRKPKKTPGNLTAKAVRRGKDAPTEEETAHRKDRPKTVMEVLTSLDLVMTEPLKLAIAYIDENLLRPYVPGDQYAAEMEALREYLEEKI